MHLQTRRKRALSITALVAILTLGTVATAWACTVVATLDLSVDGDAVTVVGQGFSWKPIDSVVEVQVQADAGGLLGTARPDLFKSSFEFATEIPADLAPGRHIVIGTQTDAFGNPVPGTPARGILEID